MPIKKTNKEEIIETCKEVFHRNGYYNTSMADLAKACGLMKGSFYHYFGSKEEIMKTVLLSSHQELKNQVLSIGHQLERDPQERLATVLDLITYHVSSFQSCLFGNTTLETALLIPEFQQILQLVFTDIQLSLESIYSTKFTNEASKKKAMQAVQQVQGAVMMMKLYNNPVLLQEAKQHLIDSF